MRKVKVLCSFVVEIEMDDEAYKRRYFIIEENGCPGTGSVGREVNKAMEWSEESECCWACKLSGSNRIIMDDSDVCRHTPMPRDKVVP